MEQPVVGRFGCNLMVDDQPRRSIDRRLDIVGRRLGACPFTHRPRIELTFYKTGAIFRLKSRRQSIKVGAACPEGLEGRSRLFRIAVSRLARINAVEVGKISRDLLIDPDGLFGDLAFAHNPLGARHRPELRTVEGHQTGRGEPGA